MKGKVGKGSTQRTPRVKGAKALMTIEQAIEKLESLGFGIDITVIAPAEYAGDFVGYWLSENSDIDDLRANRFMVAKRDIRFILALYRNHIAYYALISNKLASIVDTIIEHYQPEIQGLVTHHPLLVTMILPDLLATNLKIVFCGTAASDISAREDAYYANPTNYFWRTLHNTGLTPYQFEPKEFPKLLEYNIGLTDIAKQAQGNDSGLKKDDFDSEALRQKILKYQPQILAFTSKKGASVFFGKPTKKIKYGLQEETLGKTRFWVLTSPSGAARGYWDESIWQALADHIKTP